MTIKNDTPLKIAADLLQLERNRDELLLANGRDLRPLYIRKGRKYIQEFLKAASDLGSYKRIIEIYPHEINLLDTFLDHSIIVTNGHTSPKPKNDGSNLIDLQNKKSMSLYLLLSQSCNMGCIYCLNGKKTYQPDKKLMMSRETAFRSIDRCIYPGFPRLSGNHLLWRRTSLKLAFGERNNNLL